MTCWRNTAAVVRRRETEDTRMVLKHNSDLYASDRRHNCEPNLPETVGVFSDRWIHSVKNMNKLGVLEQRPDSAAAVRRCVTTH